MKLALASLALASATLFASCTTGKFDENGTTDDGVVRAQYSLDSMKFEMSKQGIIDSMTEVARIEREAALEEQAAAYAATRTVRSTTPSAGRSAGTSSASSYSNNTYAGSASQPVYTAPEKRGWSAKAKGAVIGAGTGAVTGAVINKRDRAKGAIIGGVLGAGAGTGVGAIIDRKKGR